jgi:DNA-binding IclR family transcriptional regulator
MPCPTAVRWFSCSRSVRDRDQLSARATPGTIRAGRSHCAHGPSTMNTTAPPAAEQTGRARTIQSVDRAAALLKAIADSARPPTVVELAERTGLNRSTAWRLLATLDAHGLVERDPVSQRYSVGYAILRIAASAEHDSIVRRARPVLEQLALETGEAVNLALARGVHLVYVDQIDPPQILAPNWLGRHVPLHATSSGKAFLAHLDRAERDGLLGERLEGFTATTRTDRAALETELAAARQDGYAVCNGELEESLYGASSAVLSEQGRPLAVISVWGPESRVPGARLPLLGKLTLGAAGQVRELLR